MTIFNHIKATMMCTVVTSRLSDYEDSLSIIDEERDNCGIMSNLTQANDVIKANEKILLYIDSLRGKQRVVTPAQISKDLGYSQDFIESILIANGFQED